jgi:general secretion pathway protein I
MRMARLFPGIGESDFECTQLGVSYQGKLTVVRTPNDAFRRVTAQIVDAEGSVVYSLATILGRTR